MGCNAERTALAEDLSGPNAEQWQHGTLCGEWDVEEEVVAQSWLSRNLAI
jgi:hypothetical protein